jgi:hypothetical protein
MLVYQPLLHWLDIDLLLTMRQVDKTTKEEVDIYFKTKKKFITSVSDAQSNRKWIKASTSLTHLNLTLPIYDNKSVLSKYITPTLESIRITLEGHFDIIDDLYRASNLLIDQYSYLLDELQDKINKGEMPQLHEIELCLDDNTVIGEDVVLNTIIDISEYGAEYDIEYISSQTKEYDPIHYWLLGCEGENGIGTNLGTKFINMLSANTNQWTKISYPYDFFEAAKVEEMFPQTRWTNWLHEDPSTIQDHIDSLLAVEAAKKNICSRDGHYKCSICRISKETLETQSSS